MKYAQPPKAYWLIFLISLGTVLFTGCGAKAPESGKQQGTQVLLNNIEHRDVDGKTEIVIEGTEPIQQYTSFQLTEPLRLVVDISDADIGKFSSKIEVNSGAVIDITPSQKDTIARLEIALTQAVDTKVYQSGGKLMVELAKPVEEAKTESAAIATAAQMEQPQQEQATQPEQKNMATVVSAVQASAGKDGVKVVILGDGAMEPNVFMLKDNRLVVDIPGTKNKVRPSVVPVRKGGLARVRIAQHADKVRVVLDLTKPLEYTVTPDGNSLIIAMLPAVTVAKPEEKRPQEFAQAQEPERLSPSEKEAPVPQEAAPVAALAGKKEVVETGKKEIGISEPTLLSSGRKYTGRKISLDLQDADLVNVMRLFAEVANLNIILSPEVKGRVTVRMVNIPWDQAMDIILRMNGLGYALEDNVLRIASVSALTKEAEDDMRSKEAKKKSEDLITRIVPVNYAKAGEIEPTIKKSLSARGETVTDVRTNTLIIKDIPRNVDEVVSLIKLLDKPIAQIMIEARIVEASLTFNRSLGVQWGGSSTSDAAHGNPLGVTFPNSVGITGGPSMGATPSGSGNYFVNMPAAAGAGTGGGAIGFTFGSLSKSLNLDLVLSALESTGEGKVISTPRVSALDNKEAKIEQGVSIPFATSSASGGTNIQFIDAKLSLIVTPHATPDNKIFMKIQATKNAPDTSQVFNGQPSIRKNEATTEILLADGETAVIGGILIVDRGQTITKVPFFADLPLIGWLFKSKTTTEDKRELIIFITPRVVRQEVI
jgi:type IV pilus secretin PilQ/predicted competence protein